MKPGTLVKLGVGGADLGQHPLVESRGLVKSTFSLLTITWAVVLWLDSGTVGLTPAAYLEEVT